MARIAGETYVAIDNELAREITRTSTNLTFDQISACLGYKKTWYQNVLNNSHRMAMGDVKRLKEILNSDLEKAVVSDLVKEEVEAGKVTSADITRLIEALDRVTAEIQHLEQTRSDDTDRVVNMFMYMVEKIEGVLK